MVITKALLLIRKKGVSIEEGVAEVVPQTRVTFIDRQHLYSKSQHNSKIYCILLEADKYIQTLWPGVNSKYL